MSDEEPFNAPACESDDDAPFAIQATTRKAESVTIQGNSKKRKQSGTKNSSEESTKVGRKKKQKGKATPEVKEKKADKNKKKTEADDEKYEQYYRAEDYREYPLYATTIMGPTIKKIIEIIAPLTPDAVLRFSQTGLSIFGMEHVKMALLSVNFDKCMFEPYNCQGVFQMGIDTTQLSRLLQV